MDPAVISSELRDRSIVATVEAVVMVMMVVVMMIAVTTISGRHHDDAGLIISAILAVVMVVVVVMIELRQLDVLLRRWDRRGFIDRLQRRCGVRDRLQKLGE